MTNAEAVERLKKFRIEGLAPSRLSDEEDEALSLAIAALEEKEASVDTEHGEPRCDAMSPSGKNKCWKKEGHKNQWHADAWYQWRSE